ncbi:hemolysin-III related-domain-containing protein [Lactifluus volemus]|nr:hemolysin-III related-domain-containing protein [Lactifluus volemus]
MGPHISCQPTHHSLDSIDMSSASPAAAFASLHLSVLSCLTDIETFLSQLESPLPDFDFGQAITRGELKVEEVRAWARDGLEILKQTKAELRSHLPEFNLDSTSVETYVSARLHDLSDASNLKRVTSRLHELPVPHLHRPEHYVDILSTRLKSLHHHLSSSTPYHMGFSSLPSTTRLSELIDTMMSSDRLSAVLRAPISRTEDVLGKAASDIARAIERSVHGAKLITYGDLPMQWRNNHLVTYGYRFIPLRKWPLIIASIFALHNETLNIHTHFVPFLLWTGNTIFTFFGSSIPSASASIVDTPTLTFTLLSLLTLFASVVWHTMTGCAHHKGMMICAKFDYAAIGWLISGSIGTVVHYGFQCNTVARTVHLTMCLINALGGTMIAFLDWFDQSENKVFMKWRIVFFVSMSVLMSFAPLAQLVLVYSLRETFAFIRPVIPSIVSYLVGIIFYGTRFPECMLPTNTPRLAWLGGGSHAVWHLFVVWAISLHRNALPALKYGVSGAVSAVSGVCPVPAA